MAKYPLFLNLVVSYKVKKTGVNGSVSASLPFTLVFFTLAFAHASLV